MAYCIFYGYHFLFHILRDENEYWALKHKIIAHLATVFFKYCAYLLCFMFNENENRQKGQSNCRKSIMYGF